MLRLRRPIGGGPSHIVKVHVVGLVKAERRDIGHRSTGHVATAVLDGARRCGGGGVSQVALGRSLPRPLPLLEERRYRDGGEDADDDHDDQKLDEGEAPLIPLYLVKLLEPLDEKLKHTLSSSVGCLRSASTYR